MVVNGNWIYAEMRSAARQTSKRVSNLDSRRLEAAAARNPPTTNLTRLSWLFRRLGRLWTRLSCLVCSFSRHGLDRQLSPH
jgi:hypothetical protein